ncbi:MAG: hypothetical protein IPK11_00845 [Ignavibacteria bacterium]|nr:hypothetical protein [Ignavibacteria bacterium]
MLFIFIVASVPIANTSTVFSAGSETYDNVVEIRENAGWTIGELGEGANIIGVM